MTDDPDIDDLRNRLTVDPAPSEIDPEIRLRGRFADALEGTDFGHSVILPTDAAAELTKPHHAEIIATLRSEQVASITDLADHLEKDKSTISRHLDTLAGYDVVEFVDRSNGKQPRLKHEHVLFSPLY